MPVGPARRDRIGGRRDRPGRPRHAVFMQLPPGVNQDRLDFPQFSVSGDGMAYLGITATSAGLTARRNSADVAAALAQDLARVPEAAPVVILIHGYRFDPCDHAADPHRTLFAFEPPVGARKVRSWPRGLGFSADRGEDGLCIGFGWPASAGHLASLVSTGRTGFARIYDAAPAFGAHLAELIGLIRRLAPGRRVDLLAHSLGARVALSSLPHLAVTPERIILLGAAEFDGRVLETLERLPARGTPQFYNITARANDPYDAIFETFAPRRSWRDRAIGHGLGTAVDCWLDLQIDRGDVTAWINQRGIPLSAARTRFCHWSFYTRRGAFELYQAILRRRAGWDIPSLRRMPCFTAQEPRWSRLRPRIGVPDPVESGGIGGGGALKGA